VSQAEGNSDALAAIHWLLGELEALCQRMEVALMKRDWAQVEETISDSRRATHALQNAMEYAREVRTTAFDEEVFSRLKSVGGIRNGQMKRLQQYRDAISNRLKLLARGKVALRSMGVESHAGAALNDVR
jgi:hypothetical protein